VIVVDTSVWVDVLNDVDSGPARTCVGLIEGGEPVLRLDPLDTLHARRVFSAPRVVGSVST
jgi:hypothetical protein